MLETLLSNRTLTALMFLGTYRVDLVWDKFAEVKREAHLPCSNALKCMLETLLSNRTLTALTFLGTYHLGLVWDEFLVAEGLNVADVGQTDHDLDHLDHQYHLDLNLQV